nr:MAG TPA: hypothetical protein [Caudoviricetes sp.]
MAYIRPYIDLVNYINFVDYKHILLNLLIINIITNTTS